MRALAFSILTLLPYAPAFAQEIPGSAFESGNWYGAAYEDGQGKFFYCDLNVSYTTGEMLWIGLYADDSVTILLSHPDVRFNPGDQFNIQIMMEWGLPLTGVGSAWDENYAGITFSDVRYMVDFLSGGQYFRMLGIGIDAGYDVTGIAEALSMTEACLAQNSGNGKVLTPPPSARKPPPKVPDLTKPRTTGVGTGNALGTPAPKPQP